MLIPHISVLPQMLCFVNFIWKQLFYFSENSKNGNTLPRELVTSGRMKCMEPEEIIASLIYKTTICFYNVFQKDTNVLLLDCVRILRCLLYSNDYVIFAAYLLSAIMQDAAVSKWMICG